MPYHAFDMGKVSFSSLCGVLYIKRAAFQKLSHRLMAVGYVPDDACPGCIEKVKETS